VRYVRDAPTQDLIYFCKGGRGNEIMIMQAAVLVAGANECFVLGSMQLELAVQMCVCPS